MRGRCVAHNNGACDVEGIAILRAIKHRPGCKGTLRELCLTVMQLGTEQRHHGHTELADELQAVLVRLEQALVAEGLSPHVVQYIVSHPGRVQPLVGSLI